MPNSLFDNNRNIVAATEQLLAQLEGNETFRAEDIGQGRALLGSIIMAQVRMQEEQLVAPLKASGELDTMPAALAALAAMRQVHLDYSAHVRTWSPQTIQTDRAGYVRAVSSVFASFKAAIAQVERDLYRPGLARLEARRATAG